MAPRAGFLVNYGAWFDFFGATGRIPGELWSMVSFFFAPPRGPRPWFDKLPNHRRQITVPLCGTEILPNRARKITVPRDGSGLSRRPKSEPHPPPSGLSHRPPTGGSADPLRMEPPTFSRRVLPPLRVEPPTPPGASHRWGSPLPLSKGGDRTTPGGSIPPSSGGWTPSRSRPRFLF